MQVQHSPSQSDADHGYDQFLAQVQINFNRFMDRKIPVFEVDLPDGALWDAFLNGIPAEHRQHYNCHCCRHFIEHFGALVYIVPGSFHLESPLWSGKFPPFFRTSVDNMRGIVENSPIHRQFLHRKKVLGTPHTGPWSHLSVTCTRAINDRHNHVLSDDQLMAEKKQDYEMLSRGLAEYRLEVIRQGIRVLENGTPAMRAEKVLGPLRFLERTHNDLESVGKRASIRRNVIWLAVATAPAGFCHVKQSVASTLLDDIQGNLSFTEIERRFREKMDPLQYQRPTAAPKAGAIDQAEKLFEQMGAAGALRRRRALLSEMHLLWAPDDEAPEKPSAGIFDHLRPTKKRRVSSVALPETTMTLEKFMRTMAPQAIGMQLWVSRGRQTFQAFTTQVDPEATPILQWDSTERRNPVATYVYHYGSLPSAFGLREQVWVPVLGIAAQPHEWFGGKSPNQRDGRTFLLDGCYDTQNPGTTIFPETLKSEFHGVRSVIEAHSRSMKMEDVPGQKAAGIAATPGNFNPPMKVEVRTELGIQVVLIDRWD